MVPVVYFLVLFSIIVHGLSIPALDLIYRWRKIPPIIEDDPAEVRVMSENDALPNNAYIDPRRRSMVVNNRFSRPTTEAGAELHVEYLNRRLSQQAPQQRASSTTVVDGRNSTFSAHTEHSDHTEHSVEFWKEAARGQYIRDRPLTARDRADDGGLNWEDGSRPFIGAGQEQ
jgi:hypothetical protein